MDIDEEIVRTKDEVDDQFDLQIEQMEAMQKHRPNWGGVTSGNTATGSTRLADFVHPVEIDGMPTVNRNGRRVCEELLVLALAAERAVALRIKPDFLASMPSPPLGTADGSR